MSAVRIEGGPVKNMPVDSGTSARHRANEPLVPLEALVTAAGAGQSIGTTADPGIDVPLESILCTDELNRRPSRPADHQTENRALVSLAQALADSPRTILQTLANTILEVFHCGSGGISLVTEDGKRFHWPAIAGMWKPHIGGGTPRDFGPCGDVLDRNIPLLFRHFERRYTYFLPVTPPIEECLLVPFYVEGRAVGTIWAITHDDRRRFDNEDLRMLVSLGRFASSAYWAVESVHAVEESKRELADFIESASVAMHWVGPDGTMLWANRAEMEMLGYASEEYIGHHIAEFHADQPVIEDILERLAKRETLHDHEARLRCKNGSIRHVLINSNVLWKDDKFIHTRCFTRDVTERKNFERERETLLANEQASRLEAEAANRSKDVFLATLSHEVRTPLSAMLGWATLLRNKQCTNAEMREGIEVIERNCRAQAQLIDDVLDMSRIVSGKLRLDVKPCDLASVIYAAIDVVRSAADAKEIELGADIDPDASPVSCDNVRMQQVIWNLLSNAIKFTRKGGNVRVMVGREDSNARIVVSDNGQGIGPDLLPYVFERFRQADSSVELDIGGGLGLGLSIVKHIVELHGGTVEAKSEGEGRGATFIVRLPIQATRVFPASLGEEATSDRREPAEPAMRLDGLRILVVEDEPDGRQLVCKVLAEAGASITAAESVREAMAALEKERPQVLVSDLAMPDEDGFDLIRQVRDAGHTVQQLPAVALTAFADKGYARRALLGGFQVHVPKPVDPDDLIAVVASLAGRTGYSQGVTDSTM